MGGGGRLEVPQFFDLTAADLWPLFPQSLKRREEIEEDSPHNLHDDDDRYLTNRVEK